MLTVPEAARRAAKNPETIRRWIRAGRLPSTRVGTQYLVDEEALHDLLAEAEVLEASPDWDETFWGGPMPNWVAIIRQQRNEH